MDLREDLLKPLTHLLILTFLFPLKTFTPFLSLSMYIAKFLIFFLRLLLWLSVSPFLPPTPPPPHPALSLPPFFSLSTLSWFCLSSCLNLTPFSSSHLCLYSSLPPFSIKRPGSCPPPLSLSLSLSLYSYAMVFHPQYNSCWVLFMFSTGWLVG